MNKKIISLVLALVMVLGTFTSVFAETAKKEEAKKPAASEKVEKIVGKDNKIQYVIDKKLVEGYEDGSYGLDKNIKRSEITRLLVLANGQEDLAKRLQGSMKIYTDVDAKHWANGVISVGTTSPSDANGLPMLAGYPDHSFKPERDVTYAELAKMLVVLAKKDLTKDMYDHAIWATDWMRWAALLGITDDVTIENSDKAANRADAFTMVYNALYAMKEFKRVPANETRGIISNFSKDVLQLNQDSKMEYKINADTVFVTGKDNLYQQIQRVSALNLTAKDYYLGSLVRILTNDKNEVTHIIELGNPADLANNQPAGTYGYNTVFREVSDAAIETAHAGEVLQRYNVLDKKDGKMDSFQKQITKDTAYATIGFKNKLDAKTITFHNVTEANVKNAPVKDVTLKLNDKTEFYVANPANHIMKKVANINEALALLGYQDYTTYKLLDVYAGYDTDSLNKNYGAIKYGEDPRNTAKVVVFNLVNKEFKGDLLRVVESSSSKGSLTVENTDGKLFDRNELDNITRFPLAYGAKLDVVEITGQNIVTKLDHSDRVANPIVKIDKVTNGGRNLEIVDVYGVRSTLDITDADVFSAVRYGKLEAGTMIQFRVENKDSNVAEIISLLGTEKSPASNDLKLEGSLVGVCPVAHKDQEVGTITHTDVISGVKVFDAKVDNNLFNAKDQHGIGHYAVYDNEGATLVEFFNKFGETRKIAFKVAPRNEKGYFVATDLRDNETQLTLRDYLDKVAKEEAEKEVKAEMAKLSNADFKDLANTDLTQAAIKKAVEDAAKAKVDAKKVDVEVELVEAPANNADYEAGKPVKAKVTLKSKAVNTVTESKQFEGNVKAA